MDGSCTEKKERTIRSQKHENCGRAMLFKSYLRSGVLSVGALDRLPPSWRVLEQRTTDIIHRGLGNITSQKTVRRGQLLLEVDPNEAILSLRFCIDLRGERSVAVLERSDPVLDFDNPLSCWVLEAEAKMPPF